MQPSITPQHKETRIANKLSAIRQCQRTPASFTMLQLPPITDAQPFRLSQPQLRPPLSSSGCLKISLEPPVRVKVRRQVVPQTIVRSLKKVQGTHLERNQSLIFSDVFGSVTNHVSLVGDGAIESGRRGWWGKRWRWWRRTGLPSPRLRGWLRAPARVGRVGASTLAAAAGIDVGRGNCSIGGTVIVCVVDHHVQV